MPQRAKPKRGRDGLSREELELQENIDFDNRGSFEV
jgi:hypothetical protein